MFLIVKATEHEPVQPRKPCRLFITLEARKTLVAAGHVILPPLPQKKSGEN